MSLIEKINNDIKEAMKAKEKVKLESLRSIKSQILLAQTEKGASEQLSEQTEIKIIQRLVNQRKDSAEIYKTQGRDDLYKNEMEELSYIEVYLPKQLSEEELVGIINDIIKQVGATSIKELGKVMGIASKQLAGKADGKHIADKVKEILGKM
jgi:uncharacterized protein